MKFVFAIASLVCFAVLAGCTPKSPIVGKWTSSMDSGVPGAQSVTMKVDFKADKTYAYHTELPGGMTMIMNGTYELKEGSLTQKMTSVDVSGNLPPGITKEMISSESEKQKGVEITSTVTFEDDKMTMNQSGQTMVFTKDKN